MAESCTNVRYNNCPFVQDAVLMSFTAIKIFTGDGMKQELTALSGAEGEVLRILWELGHGSVQSVLDKMPAGRDVAYATVQTLLRRLEKKGYVGHEKAGKAHIFYPAVERADVLDSAVGTFVERLFGGNTAGLVHFLAEHGKIGADDVEKLQKLISDNEERS